MDKEELACIIGLLVIFFIIAYIYGLMSMNGYSSSYLYHHSLHPESPSSVFMDSFGGLFFLLLVGTVCCLCAASNN